MRKTVCAAIASVLAAGSSALAAPILHFDINGMTVQSRNSMGLASSFNGLTHTGSVNFGFQFGTTTLAGIDVQQAVGGTPQNQGFTGTLSNFTGQINLVGGRVTGGNFRVEANGDWYQADIVPNAGAVSNFVGGGYKIDGLTWHGQFSDAQFGNVNVAPWYGMQSVMQGLVGSFLQFHFNPNNQGFSFADMDIFVDVVPFPPAAWTGLATLAGIGLTGYIRRRR